MTYCAYPLNTPQIELWLGQFLFLRLRYRKFSIWKFLRLESSTPIHANRHRFSNTPLITMSTWWPSITNVSCTKPRPFFPMQSRLRYGCYLTEQVEFELCTYWDVRYGYKWSVCLNFIILVVYTFTCWCFVAFLCYLLSINSIFNIKHRPIERNNNNNIIVLTQFIKMIQISK